MKHSGTVPLTAWRENPIDAAARTPSRGFSGDSRRAGHAAFFRPGPRGAAEPGHPASRALDQRRLDLHHHHSSSDAADASAGDPSFGDALCAHSGDFSFSAAGTWHANGAEQSDSGGPGVISDVFHHAAGGSGGEPASDRALR